MRVVLGWKYLIVMKWIQLPLRLTASGTIPKMLGCHQERTMSIPGPVETDRLQRAVYNKWKFISFEWYSKQSHRSKSSGMPTSQDPSSLHSITDILLLALLCIPTRREKVEKIRHPLLVWGHRLAGPGWVDLLLIVCSMGKVSSCPWNLYLSTPRSAQFSGLREGLLQQKLRIWSAYPLHRNTRNCTI